MTTLPVRLPRLARKPAIAAGAQYEIFTSSVASLTRPWRRHD